jgi:hypothetical protein
VVVVVVVWAWATLTPSDARQTAESMSCMPSDVRPRGLSREN